MYMKDKWLKRWIELVNLISTWSEDTSTKIGCVIIGQGQRILSIGWNGLPRNVKPTHERTEVRPEKYKWFEHAERNAIYNAAFNGHELEGSVMIVKWYPCADCARAIIQSGISILYCEKPDFDHPRWGESFKTVHEMFTDVKDVLSVRYYNPETGTVIN